MNYTGGTGRGVLQKLRVLANQFHDVINNMEKILHVDINVN
jgi:hypothetical protein